MMRITLPPVPKSELRFGSQYDIFGRKPFGEQLTNLLVNTSGSTVVALDSAWGTGKSTFIKMWLNYLKEEGVKNIYFDAFENDYQADPFMAIASEIYAVIDDADREQFKEKLSAAFLSMMRSALDIGIKLKSQGAIGLDEINALFNDATAKPKYDEYLSMKIEGAHKDREAVEQFKVYLKEVAEKTGNGRPLIFIIDELDRCRPDFALEMLERVKHLFSVDGIVFLLVTNRNQLNEIIRLRYGERVDPNNYLHKFVNLWLSLPHEDSKFSDHTSRFIEFAICGMIGDENVRNIEDVSNLFKAIGKYYNLTFREIERVLGTFFSCCNMSSEILGIYQYTVITVMMCYIKTRSPELIDTLKSKNKSEIFTALKLNQIPNPEIGIDIFSTDIYLRIIKQFIDYDLSDLNGKKQISGEPGNHDIFYRAQPNVIDKVLGYLSGVTRY